MKKYMLVVLTALLLTACSNQVVEEADPPVDKVESIEMQEPIPTMEHRIEFKSGEAIGFNEMELVIYRDDEYLKLEIEPEVMEKYIELLNETSITDNNPDTISKDTNPISILLDKEVDFTFYKVEANPNDGLFYYRTTYGDSFHITSSEDLYDKILEIEIEHQAAKKFNSDYFPLKDSDLIVFVAEPLEEFFEDDKYILLASVINTNYSFKDGIFTEESGLMMSMELQYIESDGILKFSKFVLPEDGSQYSDSLLRMARNNEEIYRKLTDSSNTFSAKYDEIMWKLRSLAEKNGLENYRHELENIPGYTGEVLQITSGPNHIDGTVEVALKEDYDRAKKNEEGVNWPHCNGIIYHSQTGIAVNTIIDYFGE